MGYAVWFLLPVAFVRPVLHAIEAMPLRGQVFSGIVVALSLYSAARGGRE